MYSLIKPFLFSKDPEETHEWFKRNAKWLLPLVKQSPLHVPISRLASSVMDSPLELRQINGVPFRNPIGLAAGFDKNGELIHMLHHLGFGFVEVGSVTASPYEGNSKPRVFRVPQKQALINRMGLPGQGAFVVSTNLAYNLEHAKIPVGVNIASTPGADEPILDILYTFKQIRHLPIRYVTVNISCPNTLDSHNKKLDFVKELVYDLMVEDKDYRIPILLKLSPDDIDFARAVVSATKEVHGYVCGNTSAQSAQLLSTAQTKLPKGLLVENGQVLGGASGEPLRMRSQDLLLAVSESKMHDQIIIGCGGITDGKDVERVLSQAEFVQIYTSLIYNGPTVVSDMCRHLHEVAERKLICSCVN